MTRGMNRGNLQGRPVRIVAGSSATVVPCAANVVFTKLCVSVYPLGIGPNFKHTVELFQLDYSMELHQYTTDGQRDFTHMMYSEQIFPPNITSADNAIIGQYLPPDSGITVTITNNELDDRDFFVYSTFESYEVTICKLLTI